MVVADRLGKLEVGADNLFQDGYESEIVGQVEEERVVLVQVDHDLSGRTLAVDALVRIGGDGFAPSSRSFLLHFCVSVTQAFDPDIFECVRDEQIPLLANFFRSSALNIFAGLPGVVVGLTDAELTREIPGWILWLY